MTDTALLTTRPPMGWNSFDCFGSSVTEDEVLQNARFMADHLLRFGWDTVVVDIQWAEPDPGSSGYNEVSDPRLDGFGRPLPAASRFPSAEVGSFKPLADAIHSMGLRFGVHMMRGIPRKAVERDTPVLGASATAAALADLSRPCPWNPDNYGLDHSSPAAQAYYDSVFAQYAEWGVDFVKLDDVLYPPVEFADIDACATAIERSGRTMTLSLSPGKELSLAHLGRLRESATMWRISDDFWDEWPLLAEQFQRAARWALHQADGAWADADMIPFGRIGIRGHVGEDRMTNFTPDEQKTLLSLWCMLRSPLMFGGHLPDTPPATLELLQNETVLDLLANGKDNREIVRDRDLVIWAAETPAGSHRAIFWLGGQATEHRIFLSELGCEASSAIEAWDGTTIEVVDDSVTVHVPAHGVVHLVLT